MDYPVLIRSMIDNQFSFFFILPAVIIASTLIATLLSDSLLKSGYKQQALTYVPMGGVCLALYMTSKIGRLPEVQAGLPLFNQLLQLDPWSSFFHGLLMSLTLGLLYLTKPSNKPESPMVTLLGYPNLDQVMLLGSLLGAYFLVMATHWLSIYISLALMSAGSVVLIYGNCWQQQGRLASLKYILYQALTGAIMLWGMSYLYATTGHLSIFVHPNLVMAHSSLWLIGLFLSLSGLLLQLGAFPFHVWIADVYQDMSLPGVAYLATIPKLTAVAVITRISNQPLVELTIGGSQLKSLLAMISIISLVIGHIGALKQVQASRLLAYGSIAQGGLLLAGVIASADKQLALAYYSLIYGMMSLASRIGLQTLRHITDSKFMDDYAGLGPRFPVLSIGLCVALLALVGLPPTAGFTAKLWLLTSLWAQAQTTQNVLIVVLWLTCSLGSILSLYYYLKIAYLLFFKPSQDISDYQGPMPWANQLIALCLHILIIALFFSIGMLVAWLPPDKLIP